jgi:hypothetical protein
MGVCSDNGYVQLLQEFQGDPEKMHKIVLLTSYNTILNIGKLTYAIMQWPTVFHSEEASYRKSRSLAGPSIKDVTPLEDFVRLANRTSATMKSGKVSKSLPGSQLPKGQVACLTGVAEKLDLRPKSNSTTPEALLKPAQSRLSRQQEQEKKSSYGDRQRKMTGKDGQNSHYVSQTNLAASAYNVGQRVRSENDLLKEPDCELAHMFDMPKASKSEEANPICSTTNPTFRVYGILPRVGSMMNYIPPHLVSKTYASPPPKNKNVSRAPAGMGRNLTVGSGGAYQVTTTATSNKNLCPPRTNTNASSNRPSSATKKASNSWSVTKPFVHIPMPNRAEEPSYDPERYLFQQSPDYLAYNRRKLESIVSYARTNYHTTSEPDRPALHRMIQVADFMTTRLWVAQEIQKLEDRAVEQQIRCSEASTTSRSDAWGNDWNLYCLMSRAVGSTVNPTLARFTASNEIHRRGLAKMDWVVLTEESTWKS